MFNLFKKIGFVLFALLPAVKLVNAQSIAPQNIKILNNYQDSLKRLGFIFINNENELERKNANYRFIRTLVSALKTPDSYQYKFDSVKTVAIAYAPDNTFRVFTWNVMNQDGSYRFYGTIQMNTPGQLKMYPLTDYSPFIKNPEDTLLSPHEWLGAEYFKIIKAGDAAKPYYVLLGWKGNTVKTTKKVIEVLSFTSGQPVFGMPVFNAGGKNPDRIVFEYSRQVSMMLKYLDDKKMIVFDHLAPPVPKMKGDYAVYGPDLTYDGYQLAGGRWALVQDLDLRNVAEERDAGYVDPRQQIRDSVANSQKKQLVHYQVKTTRGSKNFWLKLLISCLNMQTIVLIYTKSDKRHARRCYFITNTF